MPESLPPRASLEHLKKEAKALLRWRRAKDQKAKLADVQRAIAKKYGFASWAKLKSQVEASETVDPLKLAHDAFGKDDAEGLRQLIRKYPQLREVVNQPIGPFDSPAMIRVRSKAMLDVLLEAGADINARSRWWAGSFGILDTIKPELAPYAIERGAKVTAHAAARLGMMDRLKELIAADPQLVHARGGDGQMPLHFASSIEIASFLLDAGAEIDARDIDHESTAAQWMLRDRQEVAKFLVGRGCWTDLLMAAALGDLQLVKQHLEEDPEAIRMSVSEKYFPKQNPRAGGTIYIWTLGQNKTPQMVARESGHEEVFRFLMEKSPEEVKLAQALELGDEQSFKALLTKRPGLVKKLSDDEARKLVDAAQNSNVRAVKLMLASGWPIGARGQHGATALHWASWHGNPEMVKEILKYDANLEDTENDFHATPLGWATHGSENGWYCKTGDYVGVVELLIKAGAKIPEKLSGTPQVQDVLRKYQNKKKPRQR
jgi:ankyrin repeat protein